MAGEPPMKKTRVEGDGSGKVEMNFEKLETMFHHVQMYVDHIRPVSEYRELSNRLNSLASKGSYDPFSRGMRFLGPDALPARVQEGKAAWEEVCKSAGIKPQKEVDFSADGQDIVEQLIVGLGWRVTAEYVSSESRSVLVTSMDPQGVKIVVTCATDSSDSNANLGPSVYEHFKAQKVKSFMENKAGRQGIAVLGFEVATGTIEQVLSAYQKLHPALLVQNKVYSYEDKREVSDESGTHQIVRGTMKTVDVFAYYKEEVGSEVDKGTVLRFVERTGSFASTPGFGNPYGVLPGLEDVPAVFDGTSIPAYSDHWVSNVVSRKGFLQTLEDTLGFTPKVDFNAGVVAAGEAQIESTVTGNTSNKLSTSAEEVLKNQTQVYLPTNNALSPVGHVHGFLSEIGQGVQHLACRVSDLVAFIERVNNYREITGQGFSFLRIPRSYYGRLDEQHLIKENVPKDIAEKVCSELEAADLATSTGVVDLDISDEQIKSLAIVKSAEAAAHVDTIVAVVKKARYSNMYSLLRDHLKEETYLKIVRNKVLVDIQGEDILYQIFTCNILQRKAGEEAPFLEFIQRVCSECEEDGGACKPIKPGCGGFGIRNFLTLFLSIEVSKSMDEFDRAKAANDEKGMRIAKAMILAFTEQLELSNPILTSISDAMTAEGNHRDAAAAATSEEVRTKELALAESFREKKEHGNVELKALSVKYKELMQKIKLEG